MIFMTWWTLKPAILALPPAERWDALRRAHIWTLEQVYQGEALHRPVGLAQRTAARRTMPRRIAAKELLEKIEMMRKAGASHLEYLEPGRLTEPS